jgi:hydrogenase expression/formation protein HypC
MCLSIPAKIEEIKGEKAKASLGGAIIDVSLNLLDNVCPGDYVLVHVGFAIEKILPEEAMKTLKLLDEINLHTAT